MKPFLSHLSAGGKARMVDVSGKPATAREAVALGEVRVRREVLALIASGRIAKGDVLAAARLAGIMAAKRAGELIPLCHPLAIEAAEILFRVERGRIVIRALVRSNGKTGVEMEALTATCVAALTIYDMCKSADRGMTIGPIYLASKRGGASGLHERGGVPKAWLSRRGSAPDGGEAAWL